VIDARDPWGVGVPAAPSDPEWPSGEGDERASGDQASPTRVPLREWAERSLTPSRVRALALSSMLATALVVWAGLGRQQSSTLAAALAHHRAVVTVPATSSASAPSGEGAGTAPQSAGSSTIPEPPSTPAANAAGGGSQPASSPSQTTPSRQGAQQNQTPSGHTPQSSSPPPSSTTTPASKIGHVFVIMLASPGYEATWGAGSAAHYLTSELRPLGTLLTNYFAVGHLDLPNYLAMISGQTPNPDTEANCPTFSEFPAGSKVERDGQLAGAGCVYPVSVLTLADQLTSSRHAWRSYVEDLANGPSPVKTCRHPSSNQPDETQLARPGDAYATRHNPFVYFHSLLDLGDCATNDVPLTQLSADLASPPKTPNYSFIVPNLCHDGTEATCPGGQPGGLASADAFLKQWVPTIMSSPAYRKDGLVVITFADAPASDVSGCCQTPSGGPPSAATSPTGGGGRVGALVLSPFVRKGGLSATPYNHYSLLRTTEDLFGLSHLASAGLPGVHPFGSDVLTGVFAAGKK
jgi:hypothetical protein